MPELPELTERQGSLATAPPPAPAGRARRVRASEGARALGRGPTGGPQREAQREPQQEPRGELEGAAQLAGPRRARRGLIAATGAIGAAFLASLCCVGPLVFVAFGVGAGLASTFEPLRPVFTALTVALLGVGFYVVYGTKAAAADAACAPDGTCAVPRDRTRDKVLLWTATVLALGFLTLPLWSRVFV